VSVAKGSWVLTGEAQKKIDDAERSEEMVDKAKDKVDERIDRKGCRAPRLARFRRQRPETSPGGY
jgi:hypothetical protein